MEVPPRTSKFSSKNNALAGILAGNLQRGFLPIDVRLHTQKLGISITPNACDASDPFSRLCPVDLNQRGLIGLQCNASSLVAKTIGFDLIPVGAQVQEHCFPIETRFMNHDISSAITPVGCLLCGFAFHQRNADPRTGIDDPQTIDRRLQGCCKATDQAQTRQRLPNPWCRSAIWHTLGSSAGESQHACDGEQAQKGNYSEAEASSTPQSAISPHWLRISITSAKVSGGEGKSKDTS